MMREVEDDADKFIFKKLIETGVLKLEFIPEPYDEFAWILHHPIIGDIFVDANYERTRQFISEAVHDFIVSIQFDVYMISMANFMIFLSSRFSDLRMIK